MRSAPARDNLVRLFVGSILLASLLAPRLARAETDLAIGGTAAVSDAQGDDVRLRVAPGLDGTVLDLVPEGTEVQVLDGAVAAADGSLWYQISVSGQSGYMIADYLAATGSGPAAGTATTLTDLNLRAGPGTDQTVLEVMPPGAAVEVLGESSSGYVRVRYGDVSGWAHLTFLTGGGLPAPSGSAKATDFLNLRAGPSLGDAVLSVIPSGASLELTGGASGGFLSVLFDEIEGWASADFLNAGGSGSTPPAPSGEAVVADVLNLRTGPGTRFDVLTIMPTGAMIETTGAAQDGYYPVSFADQDGWAAAEYLDFDGGPVAGSRITWPFDDGAQWYISQGYNGTSHYNANSTYQYHYSFDLARRDGATAGSPMYSPVSGTIRWLDPSSGGISIDLGDGYAVALFHLTIEPSLDDGDRIDQGDYLGYVSGPGGPGYSAFPHVHLTVWRTADGGNWSRTAVPFTGINAIAGREFPDVGGTNQHGGTDVP